MRPSIDWDREDVKEMMNHYKDGQEIFSLLELSRRLTELTGIKVGITTCGRRVAGQTTHNKIGRPRKQPPKGPPPAPSQIPFNPPNTPVRQQGMLLTGAYTSPVRKEGLIQQPRLSLSRKLTETRLIVPAGEGLVHTYRKCDVKTHGRVAYFRCAGCSYIKSKYKIGQEVYVTVKDGRMVGPPNKQHHPDCHPIPESEVIVQEIDRKCRLEVKKGRLKPKEAWEKGHDLWLQTTLNRQQEGLPALFPPWKSVRSRYSHHQKMADKFQEEQEEESMTDETSMLIVDNEMEVYPQEEEVYYEEEVETAVEGIQNDFPPEYEQEIQHYQLEFVPKESQHQFELKKQMMEANLVVIQSLLHKLPPSADLDTLSKSTQALAKKMIQQISAKNA